MYTHNYLNTTIVQNGDKSEGEDGGSGDGGGGLGGRGYAVEESLEWNVL